MKLSLFELADIRTGVFTKPEAKGEISCFQAKHFDENGKLIDVPYPDVAAFSVSPKHLLREGDILFAAKGDKNFAAVIEATTQSAVASTSFFVIRLSTTAITPTFLSWFLNHHSTQNILKHKARGTAIASIRKSDLGELEIPIPSVGKQNAIVQLAELANKEATLRNHILKNRKLLTDQQLLNSIN